MFVEETDHERIWTHIARHAVHEKEGEYLDPPLAQLGLALQVVGDRVVNLCGEPRFQGLRHPCPHNVHGLDEPSLMGLPRTQAVHGRSLTAGGRTKA